MWFLFIRRRTCSSVSVEPQDTNCCTEISCETLRLTPAAPCSAIARTTSRSVNMPTAVLPSVRTTSLTTSALILLARISCAAMPTVSFMRTVTTRDVFLRRMSPTCMATSYGQQLGVSLGATLVYIMPIVNRNPLFMKVAEKAVILTLSCIRLRGGRVGTTRERSRRALQVYQQLEKSEAQEARSSRRKSALLQIESC